MSRAVLSLGSNLGDREAHLRGAVEALADVMFAVSGVYETAPWGDPDQPAYLNAVLVAVDPGAEPSDWLSRAQALEEAAGRVRDPARPLGPRTLDVDVIAVWTDAGQAVHSDDPDLTLPHPRAHLRAFVLRPWIDIEPYGQLPGHGSLSDLLRAEPVASDLAEVRARSELRLESG
jgi:2-amino-4-hydroxy-6-hydroxymethyldihydropteridine diphosphokinase